MLNKLSKIDPLTIGDHYYLTQADEVWYFGEYTPGPRYASAPGNQLIRNIKRDPTYRDQPAWRYKQQDIERVGLALSQVIGTATATFVPLPPSVVRGDPAYDDHNLQILSAFARNRTTHVDVRELIFQRHSTRRSHQNNENRVTQQELIDCYAVDERIALPAPSSVVLFDDVLTTGRHFLAAKQVIQQRFGPTRVMGIVVCRRKVPNPFEDFVQ